MSEPAGRPDPPNAPPSPRASWLATVGPGLTRVGRLIRKEVLSILRDRRTIVTLVLMPILLYPLLTIAFLQFLPASHQQGPRAVYVVGFRTEKEGEEIGSYVRAGRDLMVSGRVPLPAGYTHETLPDFQTPRELPPDLDSALLTGSIHVALRPALAVAPRPGVPTEEGPLGRTVWELVFLEESSASREAAHLVQQMIYAA